MFNTWEIKINKLYLVPTFLFGNSCKKQIMEMQNFISLHIQMIHAIIIKNNFKISKKNHVFVYLLFWINTGSMEKLVPIFLSTGKMYIHILFTKTKQGMAIKIYFMNTKK